MVVVVVALQVAGVVVVVCTLTKYTVSVYLISGVTVTVSSYLFEFISPTSQDHTTIQGQGQKTHDLIVVVSMIVL